MGIVLAFVFQVLQEERIDALIRNLGEDDLRTRGWTASGLLDCGTAALPALYRILENPSSDEAKYRARWLMERILAPILEELRTRYGPRGAGVEFDESESPYLPACRIFQWSYPCRCCALHRGGHGSVTVALCLRDAKTFVLRSTERRGPSVLAKADVLRRYLRPVKDEKDALGLAEFLAGPQARTASTTDQGIVVCERGQCAFRFDREGRLLSLEAQ